MLSPAQQLAVETPGHVMIAACPGSGKTTVLKFRAKHLLENDPDGRLAAVTFTREAADSLGAKIAETFPPARGRMDFGTFHSLCKKQIEQSTGQRVILIDGAVQARIIIDAMRKCQQDNPLALATTYEEVVAQIDRWQRELEPVLPPVESSVAAYAYVEYTKAKARNGRMDFGDLLRESLQGMRSGKIKPLNVKYMLVDEFQDTDSIQLDWCLEHAKHGTHITIVGDDDQAIYGFRGSLGYAGMEDFRARTDATLIMLDRTYRCTQTVFKPAARLISHNSARVSKSLQTNNADPGEVIVISCEDEEAEAREIVRYLEDWEGPYSSWAVLARTNSQLDLLDSIVGDKFPTIREKGNSFWELTQPSMLMSLTSSMVKGDLIGIEDISRRAGVSKNVLDNFSRLHHTDQAGALKAFCNSSLPKMTRSDRAFMTQLQDQSKQWQAMLRSNRPSGIKMAVAGMANFIAQHGNWRESQQPDVQRRLGLAASALVSARGPMSQRLMNLTRKKEEKVTDGVQLMTLHKSKGLEYDNVWVMGCDAGVLPSSKEDSSESEERRLMYVGMTRAKSLLIMSHTIGKASRFLNEAGVLGGGGALDSNRYDETVAAAG